ncbi:hypothetical protein TW86_03575 [Halomonas sp. S2151]|nr:hypothetical protein TW86_03575 [Halomonas sp. S2151]
MATSSVAEFITNRQIMLGKTNLVIAEEVGYANQNVISMIKKGKTKLPLDKVLLMADSLEVDRKKLLRMVMKEYMPDSLKVIEQCLGSVVTENEMALIEIWRDATDNTDPEIPEGAVQGLHQGFATILQREQSGA